MYLNTVLNEVQKESAGNRAINAEHLYKVNEAIFNLPEDDVIDAKMAAKIFQGIQKIRTAYNTGKISDVDQNFFYDYLALLSTMQNQHFFSSKQTDSMLEYIQEALDGGANIPAPAKPSKVDDKRLQKLEDENERLRAEYERLKSVTLAVDALKSLKLPEVQVDTKGKSKGKGKSKSKGDEEAEVTKGKGKSKGKGAPEDEEEEEGEEPEEGKKKKKRKSRSKKWKAKEDEE
mmetsp:Transcript_47090/g.74337  ORF Transcript_47090/g.74337 Transcript_47090/m.74337 type:complete len:232 (-) Transcript_47090:112-807(-)